MGLGHGLLRFAQLVGRGPKPSAHTSICCRPPLETCSRRPLPGERQLPVPPGKVLQTPPPVGSAATLCHAPYDGNLEASVWKKRCCFLTGLPRLHLPMVRTVFLQPYSLKGMAFSTSWEGRHPSTRCCPGHLKKEKKREKSPEGKSPGSSMSVLCPNATRITAGRWETLAGCYCDPN